MGQIKMFTSFLHPSVSCERKLITTLVFILEFVAIIEMNFATDGQAVLGKRSFLISLYRGHTRRK